MCVHRLFRQTLISDVYLVQKWPFLSRRQTLLGSLHFTRIHKARFLTHLFRKFTRSLSRFSRSTRRRSSRRGTRHKLKVGVLLTSSSLVQHRLKLRLRLLLAAPRVEDSTRDSTTDSARSVACRITRRRREVRCPSTSSASTAERRSRSASRKTGGRTNQPPLTE